MAVGGGAVPALLAVVEVDNEGSLAVVNPHLEVCDSCGEGLYGVVGFGSGCEDVGNVYGHATKGYVSIGGVKAGGCVSFHHEVYGVAPGGVTVEFHPFAVLWLAFSVDVPVPSSPTAPVVFTCAGAEVFSNDVHVVVGYLVGCDMHCGGNGFDGDDFDGCGAWALRRVFAVVEPECVGGGLTGVDAHAAEVFLPYEGRVKRFGRPTVVGDLWISAQKVVSNDGCAVLDGVDVDSGGGEHAEF